MPIRAETPVTKLAWKVGRLRAPRRPLTEWLAQPGLFRGFVRASHNRRLVLGVRGGASSRTATCLKGLTRLDRQGRAPQSQDTMSPLVGLGQSVSWLYLVDRNVTLW